MSKKHQTQAWPTHWRSLAPGKSGDVRLARAAYNKVVGEQFRRFTLEGLANTEDSVDLRQIYVPLEFAPEPGHERDDDDSLAKDAEELLPLLAQHPSLFICGLPGSGKTTLIRHLTAMLTATSANEYNEHLRDHLPIPLLLRNYDIDQYGYLDDLIDHWLAEVSAQAKEPLDRERLGLFFNQGRWVILLDGLDEISSLSKRKKLLTWLRQHQERREERGFYLITSRPSGLQDLELTQIPDMERLQVAKRVPMVGHLMYVQPLRKQRIDTFCQRWFALPSYRSEDAARKAEELLAAIDQRPRLLALARRPAFLTIMAFVHATIGRLPESRIQLYERLVDAYIHILDQVRGLRAQRQRERLPDWAQEDKKTILSELAFLAQRGMKPQESPRSRTEEKRLFRWSRAELETQVRSIIERGRFRDAKPDHAAELVAYFLGRTGILSEPAEGEIQFGHLSFQEYLAAVYLHAGLVASTDHDRYAQTVFAQLEKPHWREVVTLWITIHFLHSQGRGHLALLRQLDVVEPGQGLWLASLLGGGEIDFDSSQGARSERSALVALVLATAMKWQNGEGLQSYLGANLANLKWVNHWFCAACVPWRRPQSAEALPLIRLRHAVDEIAQHGHENESPEIAEFTNPFADRNIEIDAHSDGELDALWRASAQAPIWHSLDNENWVRSADQQLAQLLLIAHRSGSVTERDTLLLAALPEASSLYTVGAEEIEISSAFWAFNSAVDTQTPALAEALSTRSHLAMAVILTPAEVAAWNIASPPPDQLRLLSALSSVLFACSYNIHDSTDPAYDWSWLRTEARDSVLDSVLDSPLNSAFIRTQARARDLTLMRIRELAVALDRALNGERELELVHATSQALAQAPHFAFFVRAEYEIPTGDTDTMDWLLKRFIYLAESIQLEDSESSAPLTREQLESALAFFEGQDTDDDSQLQQQLAECRQLGLLPIEPCRIALECDEIWRNPMTRRQAMERLTQEIDDLCDELMRAHPELAEYLD